MAEGDSQPERSPLALACLVFVIVMLVGMFVGLYLVTSVR